MHINDKQIDRAATVRQRRMSIIESKRMQTIRGGIPKTSQTLFNKSNELKRNSLAQQSRLSSSSPLSPKGSGTPSKTQTFGGFQGGNSMISRRISSARSQSYSQQTSFSAYKSFSKLMCTMKTKLNLSKNTSQGRNSSTNVVKTPSNSNNAQLHRRQNKIQIDKTFDDRIQDFVNSFPDGSLSKQLAEYSPVPASEALEDKFEYFYRPYNYTCNSKKYISYEGNGPKGEHNPFELLKELDNETHFIDEYLNSCGVHNRSQSHPQLEIQRSQLHFQLEQYSLEDQESKFQTLEDINREKTRAIWRNVHNFFLENDPRTTYFILNQLRFLTGQNQIKRKRKAMYKQQVQRILKGNSSVKFQQQLVNFSMQHYDTMKDKQIK